MKKPNVKTKVSGDYCFDDKYFQIRTYKNGDTNRKKGSKQNIQIDKGMTKNLINLLNKFIEK